MSQWTKLVVPIAQSEVVASKVIDANFNFVVKQQPKMEVYYGAKDDFDYEVFYFSPSASSLGALFNALPCDVPDMDSLSLVFGEPASSIR